MVCTTYCITYLLGGAIQEQNISFSKFIQFDQYLSKGLHISKILQSVLSPNMFPGLNRIPTDLKSITNFHTFKKKVKMWVLANVPIDANKFTLLLSNSKQSL